MEHTRLDVTSERGTYKVVIGSGASSRLGALLTEQGIDRQRLVVSAPPIWRLQGARLRNVVGPKERPTLIPDGERAKTLATVSRVFEQPTFTVPRSALDSDRVRWGPETFPARGTSTSDRIHT